METLVIKGEQSIDHLNYWVTGVDSGYTIILGGN